MSSIMIYTRYSGTKQRDDSCEAQESKVREYLKAMNLGGPIEVIHDRAWQGEDQQRPGYQQLIALIRNKTAFTLVVDQQSRLSRGWYTGSFVQDLVFAGGRFISLDGVDTAREGWQESVAVKQLVSQMELRNGAHRIRRSQEHYARSEDTSVGEYPYGYTSVFEAPQAALAYTGRGPKPKKRIIIDERSAEVVRRIFTWFARESWSINRIARELNEDRLLTPPPGQSDWIDQHVRRILGNTKYIGVWIWGKTKTVRDSTGRKRQVPVETLQGTDGAVTAHRPHLRIIDDDLWQAAQHRLAKLHAIHGPKPGQRRRGRMPRYAELHPKTLLSGLLVCGSCGHRLHAAHCGQVQVMGCPNHRLSNCPQVVRVPVVRAHKALVDVLAAFVTQWPEWIDSAYAAMEESLARHNAARPVERDALERAHEELQTKIDHLLDVLAGGVKSDAITARLADLEAQNADLQRRLAACRQSARDPVELPSKEWLIQQLQDLPGVLASGDAQATLALRQILGPVRVVQVLPPGRKRGYARLEFQMHGWELLKAALGSSMASILPPETEHFSEAGVSPLFALNMLPLNWPRRLRDIPHLEVLPGALPDGAPLAMETGPLPEGPAQAA